MYTAYPCTIEVQITCYHFSYMGHLWANKSLCLLFLLQVTNYWNREILDKGIRNSVEITIVPMCDNHKTMNKTSAIFIHAIV